MVHLLSEPPTTVLIPLPLVITPILITKIILILKLSNTRLLICLNFKHIDTKYISELEIKGGEEGLRRG